MISTHVPRAGDDNVSRVKCADNSDFNPRPPCGRRRGYNWDGHIWFSVFQPTSPVRETTVKAELRVLVTLISTHVPRAGDDKGTFLISSSFKNFNPRPPCGRRPTPSAV